MSSPVQVAIDSFFEEKESVSEGIYEWAYDYAEQTWHTSHDVSIMIEGIQEVAELNVLRVNDMEYIIHKPDEERQLTLQLMCDYAKQRGESKCYNVANVVSSMFFAYIAEMVDDGNGSLWADYILDMGVDAPAYQFYQKAVDNTIGWVMFDYE